MQGLGAELVFALFLYRNWRLPVAMLAGAGAGLAMAINDLVLWYAGAAPTFAIIYLVSAVIGGRVLAGGLGVARVRGLAATGALDRFAAGRERPDGLTCRRATRRPRAPRPSRRGAGVGATAGDARWPCTTSTSHRAGGAGAAARRVGIGQVDAAARAGGRARRRRRGRVSSESCSSTAQPGVGVARPRRPGAAGSRRPGDPRARRRRRGVRLREPRRPARRDLAARARRARRGRPRSAARSRRRPRSRAGRSSGSRSPACSRCARASSCSTSRPRTSIPRACARCATPWRGRRDATGATLVVIEHRVSVWLPVVDRVIVLGATGGVLADGRPDEVLGSRAAELRAAGVWVPDEVPSARAASPAAGVGASAARRRRPRRRAGAGVAGAARASTLASTPGRILAVTGPNGVGKSTLGLTLAGLLRPDGGRLEPTARLAARPARRTDGVGARATC